MLNVGVWMMRFVCSGTCLGETHKPGRQCLLLMQHIDMAYKPLLEEMKKGHEGKFSIYVHASKEKPIHVSPYFVGRDIRSEPVVWGKISMVEAERRLLANALLDPDNQHFVLLSESCVPVRRFEFVYNYLLLTNVSFIDCYVDPGPHGNGRYIEHMLPEVEKKDFRKGSQWFSMKRQHAIIIMADNLYFSKFRHHCRPNMEGNRNCYADEHYLPTFFNMLDPGGIANWSVTYVDWSEGKWHPRSFRARDITYQVMKNIAYIDESPHFTSDAKRTMVITPCVLNGSKRSCYLFARKFFPEAQDKLIQLYTNSTIF
ncbi:glycosyltransferase BC10 isoform X2 [Cajanus cajan]|uniref:glycosyltransferase BC10 isoform X2 n=1 Tax=Cajanus cajan TaxID=3821 RepID=UPI00098DB0AA|nr:glycosyltransferase BC10 isoform X2 [Cajanus cajan]